MLAIGLLVFLAQDPAAASQATTPDQIEAGLPWQTGSIRLGKSLATLRLENGFRYLDPRAARTVLETLWGNPPGSETLGMVFPPDKSVLADDGWGVVLRYVEDGHVADDEASEIDYDALLRDMKNGTKEENGERVKRGYEPIELMGWAAKPHYDRGTHKLYWAKELSFGQLPVHTLNYDVRALGRKGVLSMNAVAGMPNLAEVETGMQQVLKMVEFESGNRYEDYSKGTDKLATYGIGTLIAGGVLAKAGFFKALLVALLAAKKFVVVGLVAAGGFIAKLVKGRRGDAQKAS